MDDKDSIRWNGRSGKFSLKREIRSRQELGKERSSTQLSAAEEKYRQSGWEGQTSLGGSGLSVLSVPEG